MPFRPPIQLTGLALTEQDTVLTQGAVLPFSANNIRFDFQGAALRSQGDFTYRYRMLGLDSSWVEVSASQNVARFPSLPPGEFRFEVVTVNEDGIRSSVPATFAFRILKPWYQTWWFMRL